MSFLPQNAGKFAISPAIPVIAPELSSKEVATHETFHPFFRLTR